MDVNRLTENVRRCRCQVRPRRVSSKKPGLIIVREPWEPLQMLRSSSGSGLPLVLGEVFVFGAASWFWTASWFGKLLGLDSFFVSGTTS